jgi:ATP-dependent RNA helicase HelY
LQQGLLDGLTAPDLAAVASVFTFEARGQNEAAAPFPNLAAKERWEAIERLAGELNGAEEEAGLPLTRNPEPGFMALAHGWASGENLEALIDAAEISGGDFVRNVKQLVDLLRQLGEAAPDPSTAAAARSAGDRLFRGVVAASAAVSTPDEVEAG